MGLLHIAVAALSLSQLAVAATISTNIDDIVPRAEPQSKVNQTTCDGRDYLYRGLAGYGLIPSNARDKFGDTLGGIGSSIALDRKAWKKTKNGKYEGIIWGLPDRGWYDPSLAPMIYIDVNRFDLRAGTPKGPSISSPEFTNSR